MIKDLTQIFCDVFATQPDFAVRAPGRVNLIGEHIDYLEGFVMPMEIDRAIYAVVAPNQTDRVRIWTSITKDVD